MRRLVQGRRAFLILHFPALTDRIRESVRRSLPRRLSRERVLHILYFHLPIGGVSCLSRAFAATGARYRQGICRPRLFKLKSVRLDAHEPTGTCILHGSDVCVSGAEPEAISPAPTG